MQVRTVDPRDQTAEVVAPAYRVFFWTGSDDGYSCDEYECSDADVTEVLAWADAQAGRRSYSLWARIPDPTQQPPGVCLVRLAGWDPPAGAGNRPSWAASVPDVTTTGGLPAGDGDTSPRRSPTSHERRSGEEWDASYRSEPPPWDIGRPQPAFAKVAERGGLTGAVLDVGCGTGEHSLLAARRGLSVLGVDVSPTALALARNKAAAAGVAVDFQLADALHLERLERRFDTIIDCGVFHTFDTDERARYVRSLAAAAAPAAAVHVLCFSDEGGEVGPHPVSARDLRAAFSGSGVWSSFDIAPAVIVTNLHSAGLAAWLATVRRA